MLAITEIVILVVALAGGLALVGILLSLAFLIKNPEGLLRMYERIKILDERAQANESDMEKDLSRDLYLSAKVHSSWRDCAGNRYPLRANIANTNSSDSSDEEEKEEKQEGKDVFFKRSLNRFYLGEKRNHRYFFSTFEIVEKNKVGKKVKGSQLVSSLSCEEMKDKEEKHLIELLKRYEILIEQGRNKEISEELYGEIRDLRKCSIDLNAFPPNTCVCVQDEVKITYDGSRNILHILFKEEENKQQLHLNECEWSRCEIKVDYNGKIVRIEKFQDASQLEKIIKILKYSTVVSNQQSEEACL
jgi:uncharacterized protein YuzE